MRSSASARFQNGTQTDTRGAVALIDSVGLQPGALCQEAPALSLLRAIDEAAQAGAKREEEPDDDRPRGDARDHLERERPVEKEQVHRHLQVQRRLISAE